MAEIVEDKPELRRDHPVGIYFGLDETEYHSDVALGSSDMRRLSYSPPDFWWGSKWNPLWEPDKDTPAKAYGRAVHHIILEGRPKFENLYAVKKLNWSTVGGKEEKARILGEGKTALDQDDWSRVLLTGSIIRSNPNLLNAFDDAVGNEVSVFWVRDGIKRKCRIDVFKERASVDLKNVTNQRSISFPRACMRKIDDYSYHLQATHYLEGRLHMKGFFEKGLVFGEGYDKSLLEEAVNSTAFAWVFIFVQSSGAPLTWSTKMSYQAAYDWTDPDTGEVHPRPAEINEIYKIGSGMIERAGKHWNEYNKKFGLTTPWLINEPIGELDPTEFPPWFMRGGESEAI